ncbi:MAG: hypothetical protein ABJE10_20430 [bacterium]
MRSNRTLVVAAILAGAMLSTSASAQSNIDRLKFFGFLNQGFGVAGEMPILGLAKDVTTDYRAAALQLRFEISPTDNIVLQAGARSLGTSPLGAAPGAVSLDWAFYHHRFDHVSARVGRIPAPFGFLSERREVGTQLPFYRAPAGYYIEGLRSIDGAMATSDLSFAGGSLETSVFGGGTNASILTWLPPGYPIAVVNTQLRFERMFGAQVVYSTPIDGVRLIGGISSLRVLDTAQTQLAPAITSVTMSGGLEARFDRAFARGESRRVKSGPTSRTYNYYGQFGVRPIGNLWINAQGDFTSTEEYSGATKSYPSRLSSADRALGLSYQLAQNVVAKLEQHWAKGGVDAFVAPTADFPYAHYSIASFAVSF